MIRLIPLLLLLAACGVDGPPITPAEAEEKEKETGVSITGTVGIGVSGSL